jgi:hypothetical protein
MKTVCNGCEFLIIDEEEQNLIKNQSDVIYPHCCKKYQRIVRHFPYDEPYIYPCNECLNNHTAEEVGKQ